jgi:hypothetical protein
MITINNLKINNDGNIDVNITAGNTYIITSAKLWTKDTFRDLSLVKDFSFTLEPEDVELSTFNGLFFIEFETDEEIEGCSNPLLVIVTNFTSYYLCMTELILNSDICVNNLFSKEVCDSNSINKAISVNLLISAIEQCLELGQILEAVELITKIEELCSKCTSCKSTIKTTSCSSCNSYTY